MIDQNFIKKSLRFFFYFLRNLFFYIVSTTNKRIISLRSKIPKMNLIKNRKEQIHKLVFHDSRESHDEVDFNFGVEIIKMEVIKIVRGINLFYLISCIGKVESRGEINTLSLH